MGFLVRVILLPTVLLAFPSGVTPALFPGDTFWPWINDQVKANLQCAAENLPLVVFESTIQIYAMMTGNDDVKAQLNSVKEDYKNAVVEYIRNGDKTLEAVVKGVISIMQEYNEKLLKIVNDNRDAFVSVFDGVHTNYVGFTFTLLDSYWTACESNIWGVVW